VLESTERTVQVVHETEAGIFVSVGVVFHGPGVPSWLLDSPMVEAVHRSLTAQGSLDLLGCSVRPEDLTLSALYALYPDHPVCASADITGRDGNWTLELLVQDGGRVSLGHTRSLAHLYFTSAAYGLDIQLRDPRAAASPPWEWWVAKWRAEEMARERVRANAMAEAKAKIRAAIAKKDRVALTRWQEVYMKLRMEEE